MPDHGAGHRLRARGGEGGGEFEGQVPEGEVVASPSLSVSNLRPERGHAFGGLRVGVKLPELRLEVSWIHGQVHALALQPALHILDPAVQLPVRELWRAPQEPAGVVVGHRADGAANSVGVTLRSTDRRANRKQELLCLAGIRVPVLVPLEDATVLGVPFVLLRRIHARNAPNKPDALCRVLVRGCPEARRGGQEVLDLGDHVPLWEESLCLNGRGQQGGKVHPSGSEAQEDDNDRVLGLLQEGKVGSMEEFLYAAKSVAAVPKCTLPLS
mmetsp:Transcript_37389/g.105513  ORF Transcript_37389/g.105513 Transcript_37389/m.105513 type:complete len:270 (-) Transcript_37389:2298-3107(-)